MFRGEREKCFNFKITPLWICYFIVTPSDSDGGRRLLFLLQVRHYCANVFYPPFRWYRSSWPSWSFWGEGTAWSRRYPWTSWTEGRTRLGILPVCFLLFTLHCDVLLSLFDFSYNCPYTFKAAPVVSSCRMAHKGCSQKLPVKHRTRIQSALKFLLPDFNTSPCSCILR